MYLGPTQLGKRLGLTAREVNKLLEQKGYQIKTIGVAPRFNHATSTAWIPTDKGKPYVASWTGDWGSLQWDESIIDKLK